MVFKRSCAIIRDVQIEAGFDTVPAVWDLCFVVVKLVCRTPARAERFTHIYDHFMGSRGLARQGIQDWVAADNAKREEDRDEGSNPGISASL